MRVTRRPFGTGNTDRQHGAVAVLVALLAVVLMSLIAFAVDLGYAWQTQRSMVKATDAAALASARSARDAAMANGRGLASGVCPSEVATTADQYLDANRSGASMSPDGFCVLAGVPDANGNPRSISGTAGIVTVRGTTTANFSFSRIFGLNSTRVHASSTVQWGTAPLLPMIACDVRGNNGVAGWIDTPTSPTQFSQLWSGSDASTLCSADGGGNSGSGEYGMVDFNSRPSDESDFNACRSSQTTADTRYQTTTLPEDLVDWIDDGYTGSVANGQYFCGRVGQTYGATVDQALCRIRGKQAAILVVDGVNFDRKDFNNGNGTVASAKQWIMRVKGVALVRIDDYTDQGRNDRCGALGYAAGPRGPRPQIRRTLRATPVVARRAATVNGDLGVAKGGTWPSSVALNSNVTLPVDVTYASTNPASVTDADVAVTLTPSNALTLTTPTGCTAKGAGKFVCTVTIAPGGTVPLSFTFRPTSTTPITVEVKVTSKSVNDANTDNTFIYNTPGQVLSGVPIITVFDPSSSTTTTSSTTTSTSTTTTTLPPTTSSTSPSSQFRRLTVTFYDALVGVGTVYNSSSAFPTYEICDVNLNTEALAAAPPRCR